jgi:hypothetical protein
MSTPGGNWSDEVTAAVLLPLVALCADFTAGLARWVDEEALGDGDFFMVTFGGKERLILIGLARGNATRS